MAIGLIPLARNTVYIYIRIYIYIFGFGQEGLFGRVVICIYTYRYNVELSWSHLSPLAVPAPQ